MFVGSESKIGLYARLLAMTGPFTRCQADDRIRNVYKSMFEFGRCCRSAIGGAGRSGAITGQTDVAHGVYA